MLQVYWRNSKLKFKIFAELHQIEKHAACRYAYKMKMLTNFCRNHIFSTKIQLKLCYPIGTIFFRLFYTSAVVVRKLLRIFVNNFYFLFWIFKHATFNDFPLRLHHFNV